MAARRLLPGSPIPTEPPRRYKTSDGYVLLRWKVGVRDYVEVLEHRIVDGQVTAAPNVHHADHDKANNDASNLVPMDWDEHGRAHHVIDRDEVVRLYEAGHSTIAIAERVATHPGNVSRMLAQRGVQARSTRLWTPEQEEQIAAELREAGTARLVLERWPMSRDTLGRIQRRHGIVLKPGRRPK